MPSPSDFLSSNFKMRKIQKKFSSFFRLICYFLIQPMSFNSGCPQKFCKESAEAVENILGSLKRGFSIWLSYSPMILLAKLLSLVSGFTPLSFLKVTPTFCANIISLGDGIFHFSFTAFSHFDVNERRNQMKSERDKPTRWKSFIFLGQNLAAERKSTTNLLDEYFQWIKLKFIIIKLNSHCQTNFNNFLSLKNKYFASLRNSQNKFKNKTMIIIAGLYL